MYLEDRSRREKKHFSILLKVRLRVADYVNNASVTQQKKLEAARYNFQ